MCWILKFLGLNFYSLFIFLYNLCVRMFLKIEIFEKLFVVNYVKIKWLVYV